LNKREISLKFSITLLPLFLFIIYITAFNIQHSVWNYSHCGSVTVQVLDNAGWCQIAVSVM